MVYVAIWLVCGIIAMGILVVDDHFLRKCGAGEKPIIYWSGVFIGIIMGFFSLWLLISYWREIILGKGDE